GIVQVADAGPSAARNGDQAQLLQVQLWVLLLEGQSTCNWCISQFDSPRCAKMI
ncbi:unnamed protein product, partial [Musa acuminata subsp. burmannicoides]